MQATPKGEKVFIDFAYGNSQPYFDKGKSGGMAHLWLTKFGDGWKFTVVMARKLQVADWLRSYEVPEPVNHGAASKTQIKNAGPERAPNKGSGVRKKGKKGRKSSK